MLKGAILILILLLLIKPLLGAQCQPSLYNPCITKCNGTIFDISKLFTYPFNIGGFMWSPCKGIQCRDPTDTSAAVCQKADQYYNCGQFKNPVFILEQSDPYIFRIEYTNGIQWRVSIFRFTESRDHPVPKVMFTYESPPLQYNFEVTGKCIGQPNCSP